MPELSKIKDRDTGVEYDVKDAQARKDIADLKKNGNGNNSGGNVDLTGVVKSVNGQKPDENGNVEITISGGTAAASVEPAEDDIPKVFFGGALQQTKTEAVVPFRYISKTDDFSGYAEIKAQGNSSMNYAKKNQTAKMFKDAECSEKLKVDFKGWGKQNKHVYKANWIDLTHARNIVSARLWADVVKSRANYDELPELLRTSPNQGAVDGFPVKVYAAGVYQGRYTLNIPKDKWMANMDDELDTHCILCGEGYNSGCFRSVSTAEWTDEIHDSMPTTISNRWKEVINFVMNSTDEDFRANLGNYFDIPSLIDYHLYGLLSCGLDAYGKNQLYLTYDGQKWIASMYDMDSTWGLYWNGSKFVSTSYGRNEYEDMVQGRQGNLLYMRLEQLFSAELQTRWAELKNSALSVENIVNRFERFIDIAPAELVKEDYASTTGGGKFTGIPSQTTNNIQQIRSFALARQAFTDEYVAGLTASEPEEPDIPDNPSVPEDGVLYRLAESKTFNGTSDFVDTGVQLAANDIDFTIAFEATPETQPNTGSAIFQCMNEVNPYPGYMFSINSNQAVYRFSAYNEQNSLTNVPKTTTNKFKAVVTHKAGSDLVTVKTLYNGEVANGSANDGSIGWVSIPQNLIIGARQDPNGSKKQYWKGTIHDFVIYASVWSDDEINEYLPTEIPENTTGIDFTLNALEGVEWLGDTVIDKTTGSLTAKTGEYATATKCSLQPGAVYAINNNSGGAYPGFAFFDGSDSFKFYAEIKENFVVGDSVKTILAKVYAGSNSIIPENLTLVPVDNREKATEYRKIALSDYNWTLVNGRMECVIDELPEYTLVNINFDALIFNLYQNITAMYGDVFKTTVGGSAGNVITYLVYQGSKTEEEFNTWLTERNPYIEFNPHLKP